MRTLVVIGLAATVGGCVVEPQHACTDIGCGPVATLEVAQDVDPATFANATITVCVNTLCASGQFSADPLQLRPFLATPGLQAAVAFVERPGAATIDLVVDASVATVARGDTYSVEITLPNAVPGPSKSWIATSYSEFNPNGASCDPVCHTATLQPE